MGDRKVCTAGHRSTRATGASTAPNRCRSTVITVEPLSDAGGRDAEGTLARFGEPDELSGVSITPAAGSIGETKPPASSSAAVARSSSSARVAPAVVDEED